MSQYSLISTRGMSSTREMRALKRARIAAALDGSKSKTIPGESVPPAAVPARMGNGRRESYPETEFHFPDENRVFPLTSNKIEVCSKCGCHAELERVLGMFKVRCSHWTLCDNETPVLKNSGDAIAHWQLTAKLGKL